MPAPETQGKPLYQHFRNSKLIIVFYSVIFIIHALSVKELELIAQL